MRSRHTILLLGTATVLAGVAAAASGQQITVHTPYHTAGDSFFEQNSISWSGNWRGVTFSYGGGALAVPPFGGAQPGAGLSANFGFAGKDGQINFATNFASGSRQSFTTQSPSVTIMSGQTGYISDMSQTPFVTSVVPVVGGYPLITVPQMPLVVLPPIESSDPSGVDSRVESVIQARTGAQDRAAAQRNVAAQPGRRPPSLPAPPRPNNPAQSDPPPAAIAPGDGSVERLNAAQQSTAGRPAISVAEARRLHQQEQAAANEEMAALMVRAEALEEDGKPNVAKIYYHRVAKEATGALQEQAKKKLDELEGKR